MDVVSSTSKGNKSKVNKSKNKQIGLHPTKKFCTAMEAINKMKRPPTEREKVFAENIPPIYMELIQFNSKKSKQPNLKMGRGFE